MASPQPGKKLWRNCFRPEEGISDRVYVFDVGRRSRKVAASTAPELPLVHQEVLPFQVWDHAALCVPPTTPLQKAGICVLGGRCSSTGSGFNQQAYFIEIDPSNSSLCCRQVKLQYASDWKPSMLGRGHHRTCMFWVWLQLKHCLQTQVIQFSIGEQSALTQTQFHIRFT
jgi:hypothetical protein